MSALLLVIFLTIVAMFTFIGYAIYKTAEAALTNKVVVNEGAKAMHKMAGLPPPHHSDDDDDDQQAQPPAHNTHKKFCTICGKNNHNTNEHRGKPYTYQQNHQAALQHPWAQ